MKVVFPILADLHYFDFSKNPEMELDEVKWFVSLTKLYIKFASILGFSAIRARLMLASWQMEKKARVDKALNQAQAENQGEVIGGIILAGDMVHGDRTKGIKTRWAKREARHLLSLVAQTFSVKRKDIFCIADTHGTGWIEATGDIRRQGGPSRASFKAHTKVFGPFCNKRELNEHFMLVCIASEPFLISEQNRHRYRPKQWRLLDGEQKRELRWLKQTLESNNKQIVLLVHDPGALVCQDLQKVIDRHYDRLALTICGHLHARWYAWLLKTFYRRDLKAVCQKYKVEVVPAIWGVVLPWFFTPGAGRAKLVLMGKKLALWILYRSGRELKIDI